MLQLMSGRFCELQAEFPTHSLSITRLRFHVFFRQ